MANDDGIEDMKSERVLALSSTAERSHEAEAGLSETTLCPVKERCWLTARRSAETHGTSTLISSLTRAILRSI